MKISRPCKLLQNCEQSHCYFVLVDDMKVILKEKWRGMFPCFLFFPLRPLESIDSSSI